jgi:tellurite methyltransferase
MHRRIAGFHQDAEGDWVAELDCLHGQHVRHRPPFQDREWVTSETGRAGRLGAELDCPLCDRAELPDDLVIARTAGPFDETTVPAGLRRAHRAPAGTWGYLRVTDGAVDFMMQTEPVIERRLSPGDGQAIPPEVPHEVRLVGPVRLQVDFLTRPSSPQRSDVEGVG